MSWWGLSPAFPLWCRVSGRDGPQAFHTLDGNVVTWVSGPDQPLPYADHLEMSGSGASLIVAYRVGADGRLRLRRHGVFPALRLRQDDTRGSLRHTYRGAVDLGTERVVSIRIRGLLTITSRTDGGLEVTRTLFPSTRRQAFHETVTVRNPGSSPADLRIRVRGRTERTPGFAGPNGASYTLTTLNVPPEGAGRPLAPGETRTWRVVYAAGTGEAPRTDDLDAEEAARRLLVDRLMGGMALETPEPVLDAAFAHAQLRACESLFETKAGLMHSPGGGEFYAALWTNDQCEYVNPFFPFTGYGPGIDQARNCYRLFQERMDPRGRKPLVSSIVAQGDGSWNGAGDRGDGAMFAYGAARFGLALGDPQAAQELWPGIEWALRFSLAQRTTSGVIASDSDELEGRFPAGKANLFTSCLVCDALVSAAFLSEALGHDPGEAREYRREAEGLRSAIEAHFGAVVEGFETYRYYEGNTTLRAWIGIPLVMGILDRAPATIEALFSDRLWTANGLRTEAGKHTFWDRSTLYALRGVFAAGQPDRALGALLAFTHHRLLGGHVPYPVEAWPEGNQRHLSAESGLYCRIFTEGLFGLRPTGFGRWECRPRLPAGWTGAALRRVHLAGPVDLEVWREGAGLRLTVTRSSEILVDLSSAAGDFAFSLPAALQGAMP